MTDTESWAWHVTAPWPGFDPANQSNLGAGGNGLSVDPATMTTIIWRDAEADDRMADTDTDDGSPARADRVIIGGTEFGIREIGHFPGGTMVIYGTSYTVSFGVWLLDDGTYMVRIRDDQIPQGVNYTKVSALSLGTFDGVDYSHSFVSTRDEPFLCFVAGTLIHTDRGLVPVQDLAPGDAVLTADHGFCTLRWTARRRVAGNGRAAPVHIAQGALGNTRDLWLSQQHRVLVSGWSAEMMFGIGEMLVAAVHLVNGTTIRVVPCDHVDYVHIMFDQHELVFSEGILTESYHPNSYSLSLLDEATRREVLHLFPEAGSGVADPVTTARPCLRGWEARFLASATRAGKHRVSAR
jgi:hypothetical protein